MTSRRDKKIEQRETMILNAAATLVERVGYANMTIEMVIDEVGIARATLYQHFHNKEDIILHAVLRSMDKLEEHLLTASNKAIEHLETLLRYMLKGDHVDDKLTGVITNDELRNLFWEHKEVNKRYVQIFKLFDELLNQAKKDGDIASEFSNEVLLGMLFGISKIAGYQKPSPHQPNQYENIVNQTVRIFLRGIQP